MTQPENPFQSGSRKVIPAVLVYGRRPGEMLMIHKSATGGDSWHTGKWNGLGGKCELDESPLQAARREFNEEAGIDLDETRFQPLGVLQFPNFKPHRNEDWLVWVWSIDLTEHEASLVNKKCDEGNLHWVKEKEVTSLPLWEGDGHFIPYVLGKKPFLGTFWYEGQHVKAQWIQSF